MTTSPYRETCAGCAEYELINRKLHEDCKIACDHVSRLRVELHEETRTNKRKMFFGSLGQMLFLGIAIILTGMGVGAVFGACSGIMARPDEPEPVATPEPCKDSATVFSIGTVTCHRDAVVTTEKLFEDSVLARCTCPQTVPTQPETP